jgi:hypothetical protein
MVDAGQIAVEVIDLDDGGGFEVRRDGQVHRFAITADLVRWLEPLGLDLARLFAPAPDEDGCE